MGTLFSVVHPYISLSGYMGTNTIVRKNYQNSLNVDVCNIQQRRFRLRSDNSWGTSAFTENVSIVSNDDESPFTASIQMKQWSNG